MCGVSGEGCSVWGEGGRVQGDGCRVLGVGAPSRCQGARDQSAYSGRPASEMCISQPGSGSAWIQHLTFDLSSQFKNHYSTEMCIGSEAGLSVKCGTYFSRRALPSPQSCRESLVQV